MVLNDILQYNNDGATFCRFSNADGKVWVMPMRNMQTAMNLYQPSGAKGKLVKRWFPYLAWSRFVRKAIHAERIKCALRRDLHDLLQRVLGVEDFEFSVFGGTPCVHQKITIQISSGERILGYCKLSNNVDIIKLFHREAKTLNFLSQRGLADCVHRALYCGELIDGIGVFVQSTIKTNRSRVEHNWTSLQSDFLTRLQQATQQQLPFEESDFYRTLMDLQAHLDWLPETLDRKLIEKTIEDVLAMYAGQEVEFSAYHADFTPWNMFVEKNKLFVFDFEYAQLSYPPFLDYFHFLTQVGYYEKHLDANEMWYYYQKEKIKQALIPNMDFAYTCYLLSVISHYVKREKGIFDVSVSANMIFWTDLLKLLHGECKI